MAKTDLDVCNLALQRVGAETIDAIDDETPAGAFCAVEYPQCRAWLLGKYRWSFANRVAQLSQLDIAPEGCPRLYAFEPPADVAGAVHAFRTSASRVNGMGVHAEWSNGVFGEPEALGAYIAADVTPLFAEYTCVVPEALWPVWFVELVKTVFAMGVAGGPLKNQSLASTLQQIAFGSAQEAGEGGLYGQARNEDSRNAPQRKAFPVWDDGPLVASRFGNGWNPGGWSGDPFVVPPGALGPITFIDFD